MNKLFTKIATSFVGIAMAIGVGVAVGSGSKEVSKVEAAATAHEHTFTSSMPTGWTNGGMTANNTYYKADAGDYVELAASTMFDTGNVLNGNVSIDIACGTFGTWSNPKTATFTVSFLNSSGTVLTTANGTTGQLNSTAGTYRFSSSAIVLNAPTDVTAISKLRVTVTTLSSTSSGCLRFNKVKLTYDQKSGTTKTLSSISVSGATTSFTVGDTFSFGGTVTAHYSDSSTANVTASTTFSGYNMSVAGNYTVTASYTEGGVIKTATYGITVSAPSTPFITPAKSSTSGYTGTNESLSFTYGNLTGSLNVTSSNTSVVTVGTPSTSADSGTVQINFVAEGSTTVKFKDGSTELASVSVSVSDPTVTITGMPSARSIATGATLNLGALITVTPTGNLSSDVTWSTGNSSIAGVTQAGVVTGAGVGSTTITVTPDDYPAGAVSCTVTVANVLSAIFGTTGSSSSTEVTDGSKYKTDYSYTIDTNITLSNISKVYPQTSNALKFGSSSAVGSMTFSIPSTIDSKPVYITSVTVRAVRYNETKGTTMLIGGVEKALTYSADDYTADLSSGEVTSFALTADSSSSDKRMYVQSVSIQYAFKKTLSSIALSGSYQTTFTKGGTFNHDGLVVTATYSDSSTADVTSSATFSGYDLSNVGNQTVTVSYTEGTTKTTTYSITVSYAAVTSVTLLQNSAEIGLNETFDYTLVTVTVSPNNANKEVTWSVSASTVGTDYVFDESGLLSGDTEGTITLKCESVADSSKYDELVVTVTGDPTAEFTPASVSGYVGKSDDIAFTYGNMSDTSLISITSSNSSIAEVDEFVADAGEGLVTVNFVAAGSTTLSISYDGGSTLDSITVTVSTDSVTALTWSAPTIKVYSDATTTVSDASSWNVHYTMASGDYGSLLYGEYTIKLGGSSITLPHTWDASEDGKVLSIEYGGFSSPTTSTVDVTQSLQAVNMPNEGDSYYQLVSADADLEAGRYLIVSQEDNLAFDGSLETIDAGQNHFSVTINNGVIADDSASSGKYFDLTVSGTAWTITSASGSSVAHSGSKNGMDGNGTNTISISNGVATIAGSGGKELQYNATSGSSNERFRYYTSGGQHSVSLFKLVTEEGEGSTNIANVAGHEAAQKAVVAFAKAMNAAFDETANCTEGVAAAWATASSAYSSNIANNVSLSADEKAYAKNLIKYASVQYTDNTDNDYSYCLERALKTYEVCIQKHGQTAFMSDVRSVSASSRITPLSIINGNSNTVAIVVIISMISVAAVGGYFFLRKRKED